MKNLIQRRELGRMGRAQLAASAVAVAAALAGAAGVVAAQSHAAPARYAGKASHLRKEDKIKDPKLEHGLLRIEGSNADDRIALGLQAGNPGVLQVDFGDDGSAEFSFQLADIREITVDAGNGDDAVRIDETNGVFADTVPTTIKGGNGDDRLDGGAGTGTLNGGNGDDSLFGGSGAETLLGGNGNDTIDGDKGNDFADLGNGDDTFVWDPGDGSDTIEGGNGTDTMLFNGADADEKVVLSANGDHLKFVRDPAGITMDAHGVETVDFNALGGSDLVTVNDLTGTDVTTVNVDLAGTLGGSAGDDQIDDVVVNDTKGNDAIDVSGDTGAVKVSGLAATVNVLHPEVGNDQLDINTLHGTVDSGGLATGAILLFVNGILVGPSTKPPPIPF
jgi:RTX calcium-binding nonapeptide repeat (4 copies)